MAARRPLAQRVQTACTASCSMCRMPHSQTKSQPRVLWLCRRSDRFKFAFIAHEHATWRKKAPGQLSTSVSEHFEVSAEGLGPKKMTPLF